MRRGVSVVVLVVLGVLAAVAAQAAPQVLVKDVLADVREGGQRYSKESVTLFGVVSGSTAVDQAKQIGLPTKHRGEFTLEERQTGFSILVRTKGNPPANGRELKVRGVIQLDPEAPDGVYVMQSSFIDPRLLIAAAVLVILAIVLILLLVKGSGDKTQVNEPIFGPEDTGGYSEPPSGPISATDLCPHCRVANPAGASFCKDCGKSMAAAGPVLGPITTGGVSGSDETRFYDAGEVTLADLTVVDGDGARRNTQYSLGKKKQRIGRRNDMEIRLDGDDSISREHAAVWNEDGSFFIQDLASTSGTFVNGQRIVKQQLMDNDEIRFGRTKLIFRLIGKRAEGG